MSSPGVAGDGGHDARAGAGQVGLAGPRERRHGEQPVVPPADFGSYYGLPVLNQPTWRSPEIPGYLFLGGLAGAGSVLAAGAQLTGRRTAADRLKVGAAAAIGVGVAGLVHDLGRPARFFHMLRVFKPTSPMNVGSWLLSVYAPAAGVAAASAVTGRAPVVGGAATVGAAVTGPLVAAYTAALVADTAVPAWHDGHREMPYVFVGSAAAAAGGLGLVVSPRRDNQPARRVAAFGAVVELLAAKRLEVRLGDVVAEPYRTGKGGAYMRAGEVLTAAGAGLGLLLGGRSRVAAVAGGAALMAASACTRWGVFHAGLASAGDPRYTVEPQRERVRSRN